MRKFISFHSDDTRLLKKRIHLFAKQFHIQCLLQSNEWPNSQYELVAGFDSVDTISPFENSFEALKTFSEAKKDWLFGYLSYDLKNESENLKSENFDGLDFPLMHFFQPRFVFILKKDILEIGFLDSFNLETDIKIMFDSICTIQIKDNHPIEKIILEGRISKEEYIQTVNTLKKYLQRGDIYEMNYCFDFFANHVTINPTTLFSAINNSSESPFSSFYQLNNRYLICASPERFLKKIGNTILSQPIKGTAKRGATPTEDAHIKNELLHSRKEQTENIMIVDLVRNDLAKTCANVTTKELCGIYSFKNWHQLISTISGEMKEGMHFTDVIKNAYPMGSMTGAPKIRAMELIEKYEKTKRGLYSGAVGYVTPEGDFDFNVVIRSILYNATTGYLSFHVGSAITSHSIAHEEYDECLLKAKGMIEALNIANSFFKKNYA